MKQIIVREEEAGQRLYKLLARYLKEAPAGFLYKMLRKKNITLNHKKAAGSEKVQAGDEICIFLSDETYDKFSGGFSGAEIVYPVTKLDILYEDSHVLLINKPAGMLTQKAKPSDISLNEYMLGYLQKSGQWSEKDPSGIRPSVCNRLDRNTSGIVLCGKSLAGLQKLSELLKTRSMHKYYWCLVGGRLENARRIEGYVWKDPSSNQVRILDMSCQGARPIVTEYRPVKIFAECTLLEVCLITGRSHQIRAHLSSEGYPIIGDPKYGDDCLNDVYRKKYGVNHQLLHACRLEFPELTGALAGVSGKTFTAHLPPDMEKTIQELSKKDR